MEIQEKSSVPFFKTRSASLSPLFEAAICGLKLLIMISHLQNLYSPFLFQDLIDRSIAFIDPPGNATG